MNDIKNIEDIFKDNFKNLNIKPTEKVWKGVSSNLWYSDIQNIFYNYTLQPASSVWHKIALKLWFRNFLIFSPKTINIYYLSVILIICSALFFAVYQNTVDSKKVANSDLHSKVTGLSEDSSGYLTASSVIHSTVIDSSENNYVKSGNNEVNLGNALNTGNRIKNTVATKINNIILHEPLLADEDIINELLTYDNSILLRMNQCPVNINIESFGDTTFENRLVNEYNSKKWYWSAESFVMPLFNTSSYKVSDNEYQCFDKNHSGSSITVPTLSGGLLVQAKHLNFSFQTGLSYGTFTDKPDYQYAGFHFDTTMITQIVNGGYYNYFEIHILNLDSLLLTGNHVYIIIHDSLFISTADTINQQQVNVIKTIEHKRTLNTYSYIEIPLIAGYTFSNGRVNFTLRSGIIAGLLTSASGNLPSPYSEFGTTEVIQKSTCKFMLSGFAGIEAAFDATKHISIIAAPVYRINLFSIYKKKYIAEQRFRSFGVKLGIKYNFK
ncbi:MAG: hypothetical protein COX07_03405 [Bacteroidetes bacterium CG23_combo_of_CG06-09_8_20_14_all_32_9]|nr:MAG: hypothetical protein COX07_03405 [Bacteroidetes bacterium CG23_combo_of_CG06-09_8_20_14_all_32_9]